MAVREDLTVPDEIQDNLRVSDDVALIVCGRVASQKRGGCDEQSLPGLHPKRFRRGI